MTAHLAAENRGTSTVIGIDIEKTLCPVPRKIHIQMNRLSAQATNHHQIRVLLTVPIDTDTSTDIPATVVPLHESLEANFEISGALLIIL